VITNLERRWRETESDWAREEMAKYFTDIPCAACKGYRLKPEALCVKVGGLHIGEVAEMSVKRAGEWFTQAAQGAQRQAERDRGAGAQGIRERLKFPGRRRARISHAGARFGHAVGRREPTHPARLADRLRAHRVLYVLDEPSIGLHQRDNARLLETLNGCAISAIP
jgi:excinuclease ABC subunit A